MIDLTPIPWMSSAACASTDPEAFFPTQNDSTTAPIRVCLSCPVMNQCREYAISNKVRDGCWGGLSQTQLRQISIDRNRKEGE